MVNLLKDVIPMARRLAGGEATRFRTTDHSEEIDELLEKLLQVTVPSLEAMSLMLAIDLLGAHDDTGISLDDWRSARQLVEYHLGRPIMPNGV